MEVMEEGNLMDRVPILVERDFEYYQKNQTVLSEKICLGVVGGSLDFPKNASFASVKLVLWWEEEFYAAFRINSSLFSTLKDEDKSNIIVKSSDPDKFFLLTAKSSDLLLDHLDVLVQEALDHADLSVLTATLGASAIIKNSLHCYIQSSQHCNSSNSHLLQISYNKFESMCEAVGERLLDLHVRLLSLYLLQDAGGRFLEKNSDPESGSPSIQGWWFYIQGTKKDLWETVPPKMAQRIFAGMLNDTLTILTVRYCQTNTTKLSTKLLVNDILDILQCVARLLPAICSSGSELLGLDVTTQSSEVRNVHAKCNELIQCLVYRGAPLHYVHKAFKIFACEEFSKPDIPSPWFTFVNPKIFPKNSPDLNVSTSLKLTTNIAVGIELIVLLAQPQPSWDLLVKVIMMRSSYLSSILFSRASKLMPSENAEWPSDARWLNIGGKSKCEHFLCTNDGFCATREYSADGEKYAMAVGALTYVLVCAGTKDNIKTIIVGGLESCGNSEWAACLDRRQSMSLCLNCLVQAWDLFPTSLLETCNALQDALPTNVVPTGGSVLLQVILSALYEELLKMAMECSEPIVCNGFSENDLAKAKKHVRIASVPIYGKMLSRTDENSTSSAILALAEALCSIDEDNKHTDLINTFIRRANEPSIIGEDFGLDEFSELVDSLRDQKLGYDAEKICDAGFISNKLLTSPAGKDSLRVIYEHLKEHTETILSDLCVNDCGYTENDHKIVVDNVPLLYTMFHIGRRPFDQYLNDQWPIHWSHLVNLVRSYGGISGARQHVLRRWDLVDANSQNKSTAQASQELKQVFSKKKVGKFK